jgi:PPOX class probable F420-dependent enzyme
MPGAISAKPAPHWRSYDRVVIDESTEFGARVARHLREDTVVWLTTVAPSGAPVPSPVWFLWNGSDFVRVFSLAEASRLRNIEANPRVSLNFAGDGRGGDIVVLSGRAAIERDAEPANRVEAYVQKYGWGFDRLRMSPEQFAQRYSVPVGIRLTRVRGH